MTRIDAVETTILDVPTIRPHILAMATMHVQSIVLVRMRCSDGSSGVGEGTTIGGLSYGDESPESIKLNIDTYLAPLLIGQDADRPAAAMARVAKSVVGNHFAKCAVETALLDAYGRRHGLPVSELLGGRVRDRLPVLWVLASGDTNRDIEEAEQMLDARRHDAFKLKIGKRPLVEDVAHVAAIKRALGDRASIRVDVNQAWDEATARRGIAMLADAGVDLVEQPVASANRTALTRLTAMGRIAIMADETLRGPQDAFAIASTHGADVLAVKVEQSGGLRAACAVGAIAEAAGVALYGGTMLEGPVGTVASAHVFATLPSLGWGTELFSPLLLTEELLETPLDYADFTLGVPDGPGLGINVSDDAVARLRRDRAHVTRSIPQGA
jgi:muconate cycloisomerase